MTHRDIQKEDKVLAFSRHQAADWLARLDGDSPDEATREAFRLWIAEAPEHAEEFKRLAARWQALNVLAHLQVPAEQAVMGSPPTQGERASPWLALGGALAGVLVLALLLTTPWAPEHSGLYVTAIGEQRSITLGDQSRVHLNTNSRLKVDYSEHARGIQLLQGEAYFEVAPNKQRPFEVYSGAGVVRAVGTAFSVYLNAQQVEVVVEEGVVEVDTLSALPGTDAGADRQSGSDAARLPAESGSAEPLVVEPVSTGGESGAGAALPQIRAGSRATFEQYSPLQLSLDESVEVDARLSWRHGTLKFSREPLQDLIDEISRYTSTRIVITDPDARDLLVGGLFEIGNTQAVFDALSLGFGIRVERVDEDLVYLSLSAEASQKLNK